MPFVPGENVALVELRMGYDGQDVENTLYIENASAWDTAGLTGLCSIMRDWWDEQYSPLVHATVGLREVVATDLTSATSGQVTVNGGGLIGGVTGTEAMPSNVSLAVAFHTGSRGRSFRGRNYIVGIPANEVNGINDVFESYAASWIAAYTTLITAALSPGMTWVVFSRIENGVERSAGLATPVASVAVANLVLDSQRRRLPGRGR
jgi:hypothetical protein